MLLKSLRKLTLNEEIDYLLLKSILSAVYTYPKDKIKALLKSKELIRVKKGLYIFGENESKKPYSKEVLANLIYGPSAISLEYMLSKYGIIPERVETLTSITSKRNKTFDTTIGKFTYQHIHPAKYDIGITQIKQDDTHFIIAATPEKALADKLVLSSDKIKLLSRLDLEQYLFEDLRVDENILFELNRNRLKKIKERYQDPKLDLLVDFLKKHKRAV